MVVLLGRGLFHLLAHVGQLRGQRLALIERLGADLAGVVDAHQARRQFALGGIEIGLGHGRGGIGPLRLGRRAEDRAQGLVQATEQLIEGCVGAGGHGTKIQGSEVEDSKVRAEVFTLVFSLLSCTCRASSTTGCTTSISSPASRRPAARCKAQPMFDVARTAGIVDLMCPSFGGAQLRGHFRLGQG